MTSPKSKALRRPATAAPRQVRRRTELPTADVTVDLDASPAPEAIFDRMTGPYGGRYTDEET